MINIQRVTNIDIPELHPYRTMRRPVDHIKKGIFIAEAEKVVRRLLNSELTVISLLLTDEWYEKLQVTENLSKDNLTVYVTSKAIVEEIVGYNLHQGIMGVARVPENRSLNETLARIKRSFLLVALDGLMNSENVGVVVRNCAAFGVDAIIVGETSSSPYLRRAVRNSMGTVFNMPVIHVNNLAESLQLIKRSHDTRVIGTDPSGGQLLSNGDLTGNLCIVLGSESDGIRPEILSVCTESVAIPMMNDTDSLNVASASAVFLYEVMKRTI